MGRGVDFNPAPLTQSSPAQIYNIREKSFVFAMQTLLQKNLLDSLTPLPPSNKFPTCEVILYRNSRMTVLCIMSYYIQTELSVMES